MDSEKTVVIEHSLKHRRKCSTHGEHTAWAWCGCGVDGYDGYWCFLCIIDAVRYSPKGITHIVEKEKT